MPYFEKQEAGKTKWWEITREAEGHRFHVSWGVLGAQGRGMTCTRDSPEDCDRMIASKIREKVKAGYIEVAKAAPKAAKGAKQGKPTEPAKASLNAVIDVFMREQGDHFTPYKIDGLTHSYHVSGGLDWFDEYVVAGPIPTLGLLFPVKHGTAEPEQVHRFLEVLEAHYDEVFSVEVAWKLRLEAPIGGFDHALVLSPMVANLYNERLTSRQLFKALPIYDCEFVGNETVSQAEARTHGRGCIPTSTWNRKPHPVVDAATQLPGKKKSKVLIYEPRVLGGLIKKTASGKAGTLLEVRNYRGAIARVVRGKKLELTLPDGEPHALTPAEMLERLEAFVREG